MIISKCILKEQAERATFGKWYGSPAELHVGAKKMRLDFSSLIRGKTPPNFIAPKIYVETIENSFLSKIKNFFLSLMTRKFIKTTYNEQTIYINVNSLSNRIGIDAKEIYEANTENKLDNLICDSYERLIKLENKIAKKFENVLTNRQENKTGISDQELNKMMGIAHVRWMTNPKCNGEEAIALNNGQTLHLKGKVGIWPHMVLFTNQILGKGFFGRVEEVLDLSLNCRSIAKIAHCKYFIQDAENEYRVLNKVYKGKSPPTGIQKKPYLFFDFDSHHGYFAPKYTKDLYSIKNSMTRAERTNCIRQLLQGLVELEKKEILHGDLKSNNCLVKIRNGKTNKYAISDYGGARNLSKSIEWTYGTPTYQCVADGLAYVSLLISRNADQMKQLLLRRDVYALGWLIADIADIPELPKEDLKQLNDLIDGMCHPNWSKRLTASQALTLFEKIYPA